MTKLWITLAGINGFLAIALSAYGSHGLSDVLPPEDMVNFEMAAQFQLIHAAVLLGVGWLASRTSFFGNLAGTLFMLGIIFFSGSMYLQYVTGSRVLAQITPFGGAALMLGWVAIAIGGLRVQNETLS